MKNRSISSARARRAPIVTTLFLLALLPSAASADVSPAGSRPAVVLSSGTAHTCALDFNGNVQCWGANGLAQVGASPDTLADGTTTTDQPQPVLPASGSCTENAECPAGIGCAGGACTCAFACPTGWTCNTDPSSAQRGQCQEAPVSCTMGSDCPSGVCAGGACAACGKNADCPSNLCEGGVCVCAQGCPGASVCPGTAPGTACVPQTCTSTCAWGYSCVGGTCVPSAPEQIPAVPTGTGSTPPLLGSALSLATGDAHTCALLQNGTIQCWGENSSGQLGNGSYRSSSTPVTVSGIGGGSTPAIAVAAGAFHTCALLADGTVSCWGDNNKNQLAHLASCDPASQATPATGSNVPVQVCAASGVTALSAGRDHTCALAGGGLVQCWGGNDFGQLGQGNTTATTSVVPVVGVGSATGLWATSLAAGRLHTCAVVTDDGTVSGQNGTSVVCWGYNGHSQLGDGTTVDRSLYVRMNCLTDVRSVSANGDHSCALLADGTVECWGDNGDGELGRGTSGRADTNSPVPDRLLGTTPVAIPELSGVRSLSSGYHHSCAVLGDGTVKCWGSDRYGRLGDNHVVESDLPAVADLGNQGAGMPYRVTNGPQMAAGLMQSCVVLASGKMLCWGGDNAGQLGNGASMYQVAPTGVTVVPTSVLSMCAGYYFSCALLVDGSVWCFGDNTQNQCGESAGPSAAPVTQPATAVGLGRSAVQVACGGEGACALLSDGTVACWGSNASGQLGNGTSGGTSDGTVQVVTSAGGPAFGGVTQIAAGGSSADVCAIKGGGSVWCWGNSEVGQVGPNTNLTTYPSQEVPAVVPLNGSAVAKSIAVGGNFSCALGTDGTAQCWGYDYYGALGDDNPNPTVNWAYENPQWVVAPPPSPPRPAQPASFTWLAALAGGGAHTCALRADGSAWCWGYNPFGEIGNGTFANAIYPAAVMSSPTTQVHAAAIGVGVYHNCSIDTNGLLACWGYNPLGQLDDGTTTSQPYAVTPAGFPRSQ